MKAKKVKLPKINFKNIWQKLKPDKIKFGKSSIIILAVNAACLIALLICLLVYHNATDNLLAQKAISRWAGDSELRYAQITCFINETEAPELESIYTFAQTVDSKMTEASLAAPDTGSLWTYAFSAESTLTVLGSYASASATAFGVGGDYFLFHPLPLKSGSYFSSDDLMEDRVIIDEELAWRIFGSIDLDGMLLYINNTPFYIAGVVAREEDKFSAKAYGDGEPRVYLSYTALYQLDESAITCYEMVAPSPITDFALNIAKESFPLGAHGEALENSGRFGLETNIDNLLHFGSRTIQTNEIAYPYWENAARLAENQMALLVLLIFLFALFPSACIIYLIVKEIKHVKHQFKKPSEDI